MEKMELSVIAKMSMFDGIVVLTVLYECRAWTLDQEV